MYATGFTAQAMDPLWFRGLGPAGNACDPNSIHATALNHAMVAGLSLPQPHRMQRQYRSQGDLWKNLWVPHSMPYRRYGLWVSPATLVENTLRPVNIFRGGTEGGYIHVSPPKQKPLRMHITETEATFEPQQGETMGRPYMTGGFFGTWTGVLFAKQPELAEYLDSLDPILIRVGPADVALRLTLEPMEEVQGLDPETSRPADHLSDPFLLPDAVRGVPHYAKPYPLIRVAADGWLEHQQLAVRLPPL